MAQPLTHVTLQTADHVVIAGYLAVVIAIGWYFRKFARKDLANYFLAGRRLPGWLNGVSNAVTCVNADVAPAYCGMTVITGLAVCWWYFSRFGMALMIAAVLFAVFWRRLNVTTSPEFYERRFSGPVAIVMRMLVSFRAAFFGVVIWIGAGLLGMAKVCEAVVGWEHWQTFAITVPVMLLYVFLSGYIGVVMNDLVQTLIILIASLILMALVWVDFNGPGGLQAALLERFGPAVVNWHPPAHHELLGVLGLIAWTVGSSVGYAGDLGTESQRLLSCRNTREAAKMYVWTQIVLFAVLAVLTLPALGAMVRWPGLHDGTINKELAYGMLLAHYLPPGLLGLALVALFASVMSTVDAHMTFAGQVFVNDVYRRVVNRSASPRASMIAGKAAMCVIMGLAIVVATVAENVIDISLFMLGFTASELTANWGQWWWWRFNSRARLAASFGGPCIFLFNQFVVFRYWIEVGASADYVVVLSSMALTCILWIVVALRTRPDPESTLVEFYRRSRPPGWWGPIARRAGVPETGKFVIFRGLLVAFLGMTAVAAGTIAFSCLYVGRWRIMTLAAGVCVVAGLAFRKAIRSFLTLADAAEEPAPAARLDA